MCLTEPGLANNGKGPEKVVMAHQGTRGRRLRAQVSVLLSLVLLLLAENAAASEGRLVLLPDFTTLLPMMILLFAVLIVPTNALLFKPIFRVLEDREEKIDGTLKRADQLRAAAEETLARYESAIREVREEAEVERKRSFSEARDRSTAKIDQARGAAEREIELARREVQEILEDARATLGTQAEELAGQAAERVLGRPLS